MTTETHPLLAPLLIPLEAMREHCPQATAQALGQQINGLLQALDDRLRQADQEHEALETVKAEQKAKGVGHDLGQG